MYKRLDAYSEVDYTKNKKTERENLMFRIKERRMELDMSQEQLAQKSGISRMTISMLENGKQQDIRVSTLKRLAENLQCTIADLLCK
jgi:DNA-binding Xre family transcriptional regulator